LKLKNTTNGQTFETGFIKSTLKNRPRNSPLIAPTLWEIAVEIKEMFGRVQK